MWIAKKLCIENILFNICVSLKALLSEKQRLDVNGHLQHKNVNGHKFNLDFGL